MKDPRLFFVSYSKADRTDAAWVARQLKGMGHTVRIQENDFLAGGNFVADMDAGLRDADHVVLVLTDSFLNSPYCLAEWTAAFARDPDGSKRHLIPVRVKECRPEGLLGPRQYVDLVGLHRNHAAKVLRAEITATLQARRRMPARFPSRISNLPRGVRHLIGRAEQLRILAEITRLGRPAVITGLPGIGKTALAIEFGRQRRRAVTWLVSASDVVSATAGLRELASQLGVEDSGSIGDEVLVALRERLGSFEDWLLVLDGLDDLSLLTNLPIPLNSGNVVITSRSASWYFDVSVMDLEPLPPQGGGELLANELSRTLDMDAIAIGQLLGGLPLVIQLAAGYVRSTGVSLEDLAARLRASPDPATAALLSGGSPGARHTWGLALESVRGSDVNAWRLLALLAYFAPRPFPRSLLGNALDLMPDNSDAAPWIRLDRAIANLRTRSLIALDSSGSVVVHPLIQSVTRSALQREEQVQYATLAGRLMYDVIPTEPSIVDAPLLELLGPHAQAAAVHLAQLDLDAVDPPFLLTRIGAYALAVDAVATAQGILRFANEVADRAPAVEMTNRPVLFSYLAQAEFRLGNAEAAIPLAKQALEMYRSVYGPDHPGVGVELSNLAMYEQGRGRLELARTLMQQAVDFHEQRLGPRHPTTATDLSNLSTIEFAMGEMDRAEAHQRAALEIHEALVGASSVAVATDLAN